MGTQRCLQHLVKMIRLILVCLSLAAAASAQSTATEKPASGDSNPNTRIFGLGNLIGGALGALGGGHHQGGHHVNPGFQQGGFGVGGFGNQGFNPGFQGVGGFPGVGIGGVVSGGGSASCRRWCRTPQGQAYCCEGANEP